MEEIKALIPGCFSQTDLKFAEHDLEIERAREVLKLAMSYRFSFANYYRLFSNYLESQGVSEAHKKRQLNRIARVDVYFF